MNYPMEKATPNRADGARARGPSSSSGSEIAVLEFAERPVEVEESVLRQQHQRAGEQLANMREEAAELRRRVAAAEAVIRVETTEAEQRHQAASEHAHALLPVAASKEQTSCSGAASMEQLGPTCAPADVAAQRAPDEHLEEPQAQRAPAEHEGGTLQAQSARSELPPAEAAAPEAEAASDGAQVLARERRDESSGGPVAGPSASAPHAAHEEEDVFAEPVPEQFLFTSAL